MLGFIEQVLIHHVFLYSTSIFRFREICILRARVRNARFVIVVRNREGGGCLVKSG
jgi:hypothetical protein